MGRIVDSYTNILTVKLFARAREEDQYVRDAVDRHVDLFTASQRLLTVFGALLDVLNALLIAGSGALALLLWRYGTVEVGAIAMVLPLTLAAHQHVAPDRDAHHRNLRGYRRGAGRHADHRAAAATARSGRRAAARRCASGRIEFKNVSFGYGREIGVLQEFQSDDRSPARRSAWSAAPAPANRPWSICCCASSISKAARS